MVHSGVPKMFSHTFICYVQPFGEGSTVVMINSNFIFGSPGHLTSGLPPFFALVIFHIGFHVFFLGWL
jgi:hypothetical protein